MAIRPRSSWSSSASRALVLSLSAALALGACAEPAAKEAAPAETPAPAAPPALSGVQAAVERATPASPAFGWTVVRLRDGAAAGANLDRAYLQQSVFKLWVAAMAMDRVDSGAMRLDQRIRITRADLGYPHQPIAEKVGPGGYDATVLEMVRYMVIQSDNPSADVMLRELGGPQALTAWLRAKGIDGVRVDRNERALHEVAAAIHAARGAEQTALIDAFVGASATAQVLDGSTPRGAAAGLAALHSGRLLSPQQTRVLLGVMGETATGQARVKAALGPGWTWAHKTGTGGQAGGRTLGVNDIGLLTAPDGEVYAVAVFVGGAQGRTVAQEAWLAAVSRAVVADWKAGRAS